MLEGVNYPVLGFKRTVPGRNQPNAARTEARPQRLLTRSVADLYSSDADQISSPGAWTAQWRSDARRSRIRPCFPATG